MINLFFPDHHGSQEIQGTQYFLIELKGSGNTLDGHQLQQGPTETVREDPLDDLRSFSLAPAFGIEKIIKCIRFLET